MTTLARRSNLGSALTFRTQKFGADLSTDVRDVRPDNFLYLMSDNNIRRIKRRADARIKELGYGASLHEAEIAEALEREYLNKVEEINLFNDLEKKVPCNLMEVRSANRGGSLRCFKQQKKISKVPARILTKQAERTMFTDMLARARCDQLTLERLRGRKTRQGQRPIFVKPRETVPRAIIRGEQAGTQRPQLPIRFSYYRETTS